MIPHAKENRDDLDEKEYVYDADKTANKTNWRDWLLLNRPLKVIVIFLLVTIIAPLLTFHFLFSSPTSEGSCLIRRSARLPCGYGNITADQCSSECCYDHTNKFCFHKFPSNFTYLLKETWSEEVFLTPTKATVPYGSGNKRPQSIKKIRISVDEVSATHLSLTFYHADKNITGRRIENKNYVYRITGEKLNVVVNSTQGNIFNTAHGTFIAAKDIWELTFKITNETMFGLGEIPLLPNTVKVIYSHKGGMSAIPLIFAKLNGSYHGLLIDTKTPTEINIRKENQLVIRSITNFGLKFHLFVGPRPSDIMRDVMTLTGKKKDFEYWMLGPHYCSDHTAVELRTLISTADLENIPFESHCGVAPLHFTTECNSTYTKLVEDGALELRNAFRKFVPHVSPYIRYTPPEIPDVEVTTKRHPLVLPKSTSERCFNDEEYEQYLIRDPDAKNIYIGLVDEHDVVYPKYDNVSEEFMKKMWVYGYVDGIVLKNNWPLDESEKTVNKTHLLLPYFNENFEAAFQCTPQWNATRPERYLYTHNEYGNQFAKAFNMVQKTAQIISTSQWMNGTMFINRQGIETSWASLHRELIEASLGGISGYWYWSSPVCGDTENFNTDTHTSLCTKWYMALAYFPMIQIYSKDVRRDPFAFTGTTRRHMITALQTRMSIISYLYSVLQDGPLLRPMFYQFPSVEELSNVTSQFSVGDDLLIVPNLQPGQTHVQIRMPPGQWFEYGGGLRIEGSVGEMVTMATTEADFLTLIRGGSIITQQTNIKSRVADNEFNPYTVLVVLHCETTNVTEEVETSTKADSEQDDVPKNNITTSSKCSATGRFNKSPKLKILFEADESSLRVTAGAESDLESICGVNQKWAGEIWYLKVYGLSGDKNNNDNHFMKDVDIRICELESRDELIEYYT